MTDFTDMLSKAKKMQERMKEVQKTLENIEVEGTAGGDLVKVVLRGDYEMKSILVTEKAKNEKREIINDLILASYNSGAYRVKKALMRHGRLWIKDSDQLNEAHFK